MGSLSSWKRLVITCIAILATTMFLGGCFGGGGGVTPTGAVIKGYVTEIDASNELRPIADLLASGPGVNGASVTLVGTGKVATTNYLGEFTFTNVPPGTYDVLIKKTGWASAIAYEVRVEANKTSEVALRMTKPVYPGVITEDIPPTVSISCPSPMWGTKDIHVSAGDSNRMAGVLLFIDNLLVAEWVAPQENPRLVRGIYTWETLSSRSGWHNGEHTITAIAVDTSGNIGCKSVTVTVDNGTLPGYLPYTPINVAAYAATIHYSVLDLFSSSMYMSSSAFSSPITEILALAKSVQSSTSQVQPLGMPAGSDAVAGCGVIWQLPEYSPPATGFKIYRDGIFIGEVPVTEPDSVYPFIQPPDIPVPTGFYLDGSPKLSHNSTVSYRVSAYNRSGESTQSQPASTTPLYPIQKVFLEQPVNDGIVTQYPSFTWIPVTGAKLYLIMVIDAYYGDTMWLGYAYGEESQVQYGDPDRTLPGGEAMSLYLGNSYAWVVFAIDSIPSPPRPLDPGYATWLPTRIALSASELRIFTYRSYY
jgi:hypothetical protein